MDDLVCSTKLVRSPPNVSSLPGGVTTPNVRSPGTTQGSSARSHPAVTNNPATGNPSIKARRTAISFFRESFHSFISFPSSLQPSRTISPAAAAHKRSHPDRPDSQEYETSWSSQRSAQATKVHNIRPCQHHEGDEPQRQNTGNQWCNTEESISDNRPYRQAMGRPHIASTCRRTPTKSE